jgi:Zn-finger nucleic acid-binding protein
MICPACKAQLAKTELGGAEIHTCGGCGGTWLDREIFENISADREKRGLVLTGLSSAVESFVPESTVAYRPCPICGKFMNRINYARISGVILDTCRSHGIWFDARELQNVLNFIEKGGLLKAQERARIKLEDARREAESSKTSTMAGMPDYEISIFGKSSARRTQVEFSDVVDFIDGAIDFFKGMR